jgi:serine/threonine protein phosphatase PrpC
MSSIPNIPNDKAIDIQLQNKLVQFANGKVNQPYSQLFDITGLQIADIGEYWFEGINEIGLSFNYSTNMLEGTPTLPGEHIITLKFKRHNWIEGDPIFEKHIMLIINPDPRSLWNNIPTPETIAYYRPDSDSGYVEVKPEPQLSGFEGKPKNMVAASSRGRSHAHEGKPRDDCFRLSYHPENKWYVITVADGAGSAEYSREGARIACTTTSEVCRSQFAKYNKDVDELVISFEKDHNDNNRKKLQDALYNIIGSAAFKSYKDIGQEAQTQGASSKDYATTLLTAVAKRFSFGWFIASFWVGDGGIGIYAQESHSVKIMGNADSGEFAGQTRFLTMPEVMQPAEIYRRLRFEIIEDFTALILMTDGVSDPIFETESNLKKVEKWDELWNSLNEPIPLQNMGEEAAPQLLKWLGFWSPGNHDDRTIALLY